MESLRPAGVRVRVQLHRLPPRGQVPQGLRVRPPHQDEKLQPVGYDPVEGGGNSNKMKYFLPGGLISRWPVVGLRGTRSRILEGAYSLNMFNRNRSEECIHVRAVKRALSLTRPLYTPYLPTNILALPATTGLG
eukprot:1953086-Pyramimonas_sp.AAC.1